jgi:acyl carrier protein
VIDERAGARLAGLLAGAGEDQAAIRAGGVYGRRLVRAPAGGGGGWVPRGTVLVTGGTGGVAGHVARWLARSGAERLVLASRSGPAAPGVAVLAADLAAAGTGVSVIACDIADRQELAGLMAGASTHGTPLTAVFHAAGAGQATTLADTSVTETAAVLAAKAAGAVWLDELTAGLDLDAFVVFSSISATWGSGGQPGYAAANAFLDGLIGQRRGRGLPGTSLAWGPWGGGGMAAGEAGVQLQRRGLRVMEPELAVGVLGQALGCGEDMLTVADVDWDRFAPAFTMARPSPLISDLPEVRQALAAADQPPAGTIPALAQRLAGVPGADQARVITNLIRAEAAAVLGHPSADDVEPGRAFRDLGFDSLTAVELRNRLTAATGLRLPATLVFDYPTPAVLADFLRAEIIQDEAEAPMPVFAELDQLESALSSVSADDSIRVDITARLQAILSKWVGVQYDSEVSTVGEKLKSATADEVFDFIDKELRS